MRCVDIQLIVGDYFKVDLMQPTRVSHIVRPRQIAMYLCRKYLKHSFPRIGRQFGQKDHTTVLHACRKITELRKQDADLIFDIKNLEGIIDGTIKQRYNDNGR